MSGNDSQPPMPGWAWVVLYLLLIGALGTMATGGGSEGNGPTDDGCSSGVSQMGCFP